jgi:hypothetical protein
MLTKMFVDAQLYVVPIILDMLIIGALRVLLQMDWLSGIRFITGRGLTVITKFLGTPLHPAKLGVAV